MTWEDLKDESTADLIAFIKCKDQPAYKMLADLAFIALTFRFQSEVVDRCRKLGRRFNHDNETCDSIAQKAFDRFYKYPFRFEGTECEKKNLDLDKCVIVFIFRIAQRCFFDHYNESNDDVSPYDGTESVVVEFPDLDDLDVDEVVLEAAVKKQEKIEKALKNLSDKHLIIYLTYLAHEKDGFKLPRKLLAKLRADTGLKQNSIRVYKKEAFEEVEKLKERDGKKKDK
jgi:DNA-directed RNA polymerase specialized sigma24 family protein